MTHQCPKCELRFTWQTELEDHCRTEHPQFQHDYPSSVHHDYAPRGVHVASEVTARRHAASEAEETAALLRTWWNER